MFFISGSKFQGSNFIRGQNFFLEESKNNFYLNIKIQIFTNKKYISMLYFLFNAFIFVKYPFLLINIEPHDSHNLFLVWFSFVLGKTLDCIPEILGKTTVWSFCFFFKAGLTLEDDVSVSDSFNYFLCTNSSSGCLK